MADLARDFTLPLITVLCLSVVMAWILRHDND